ncbi:MAG: hypothetical protein IPN69_08120 [Acidobacteria bacterium]|nr:hypothetical protein [Acidobacteriota bacterium]
METYEILEQAIPRKKSEKVAQLLSISATYVRRWRREPDSEESPNASGQRSILDRICDLLDAVYLVNPPGVALIVNHINSYYRELLATHAKPIESFSDRAEHSADLLTQTTEAINSLNLTGCSQDTLRELVDVRDAAERAIRAVEASIKEV